jgi:hypothetical protein
MVLCSSLASELHTHAFYTESEGILWYSSADVCARKYALRSLHILLSRINFTIHRPQN